MLNFVIHYPCGYPLNINEGRVCGEWPQTVKKVIIEGVGSIRDQDTILEDGSFLTKENVSVLVIPVVEDLRSVSWSSSAQSSPVLVTLFASPDKGVIFQLLGNRFKDIVKKSLRSVFRHEKLCINYVIADDSEIVPYE